MIRNEELSATKDIKRVLIVGYGSIGQRHLKHAREFLPYSDIRVFRHKPGGEAPLLSDGLINNIEDAIEFDPQIAIISNPAPYHVSIAQSMAEIGVNILIEKPLSNSLTGVIKLIQTCSNKKSILLVGYNLRFLASIQKFRALIKNGRIGKVYSVRCEAGQYLPSWRPNTDYRYGVSASRELGGGVLLELSHEIDYLSWIFGKVEWVRATLSNQSLLEVSVEDTAHLTLGFSSLKNEKKLIGTLNLDFIRHDTTRSCIAIGENGSLRWDGTTGQIMLLSAGENGWTEIFRDINKRDDSYRSEWENLILCVTKKGLPLITGEDGLKVLEIIEAARLSAASGGRETKINNFSTT